MLNSAVVEGEILINREENRLKLTSKKFLPAVLK
jgi:hypothetical protein